jgi:RNA polymerase sigma-70 factor (ECF subfamily)
MTMAIPFSRFMPEQDALRSLIREAKAGDAAAFERILIAYDKLVLRFAYRILLNADAARDAAQETFIRLHKNIRQIDENRDLAAWLYRTMANICYDTLRRAKQHLPIDGLGEPAVETPNPEESFSLQEQQQIILAGLQHLTARERQVVVLRDLEGQSTTEVAALLKIGEGTVRSLLSTGRVKLKNHVTAALRRPQ